MKSLTLLVKASERNTHTLYLCNKNSQWLLRKVVPLQIVPFHTFWHCIHPSINVLLSRRHEVLGTNLRLSSVRQARLCHDLRTTFGYSQVHFHAFLTDIIIKIQRKVEHDELAGVSRDSLHGSDTPGTVSPQSILLLVRICRRDPICLTCGPVLPGMSQRLFSRTQMPSRIFMIYGATPAERGIVFEDDTLL